MAQGIEHNRLIAAAANAALKPLGAQRKGKSRTWIADQRFWAIVIEFQPSGFRKGTYLNVGAHWFWHAKDYWSFDYGYRIEGFRLFEDAGQFSAVAGSLAMRAASEIRDLRQRLHSLRTIADCLVAHANHPGWPVYHAAVAAGLAGYTNTSTELFARLLQWSDPGEWQSTLRSAAKALSSKLHDRTEFRAAILGVIAKARALHHLQPDPSCLDEAASL